MILNYRGIRAVVVAILAIAAGSAFGQTAAKPTCLNRIGQKEWAVLLKDLDQAKKRSLEDAAMRKDQVDNLREMLAFACEATKTGLAADKTNAAELEFIRMETIASFYNAKRIKLKPGAPFSWITDAQVTTFYKTPANLPAFDRFLNTKTELLSRSVPPGSFKPPTADDVAAVKDFYARMKIAERSAATMLAAERSEAEFKARLQQSQFLARLLAEELAGDVSVSEAEIAQYIAAHPEFSSKDKRATAEKIRDRAKAGEDFAKLANEFSEDPGNTDENGKKNGGLYANVPIGRMVPPFEKASLALEPGQISDIVETDFGFHVIKLEKKSADNSTYDVRHILISTFYQDPDDPAGKPVPAIAYVRAKLEAEREAEIMLKVVAKNTIVIDEPRLTAAPAAPAKTRPAARKH